MEVMREYREAWSNVRAVVTINPLVMPQRTEVPLVQKAFPEMQRIQPGAVPGEILISKGYLHGTV